MGNIKFKGIEEKVPENDYIKSFKQRLTMAIYELHQTNIVFPDYIKDLQNKIDNAIYNLYIGKATKTVSKLTIDAYLEQINKYYAEYILTAKGKIAKMKIDNLITELYKKYSIIK
jgi:hypothetical protein